MKTTKDVDAAQQLYAALFRIVRQSLSPYPVGHDAIVAARAALNAAEGAGIGKPGATAAVFKEFYKRQGEQKVTMQSRVLPKEEDEGSTGLSGSENIK